MSLEHGIHLRRWIFSLPPVEYLIATVRELVIGSLRCGPIPEHIAFVMDGNRRYARKNKVEAVEGHHMGFEALARILEVCYKSGVRVVTIYAFSIENFNRSKYEVDALMDMAKTKLVQMSQHGELFERFGARVKVVGDRSLIREDVLKEVDYAVELTKNNDHAVLNVCFPYTGREEITHSIRETVHQFSTPLNRPHVKRPFSESHIQRQILNRQPLPSVAEENHTQLRQPNNKEDGPAFASDAESTEVSEPDGETSSSLPPTSSHTSHSASPVLKPSSAASGLPLPDPETITASTLTKNTYTPDAPPLDLLVRTSGVYRLSDFMLWQCHENTEIKFVNCLWPEFDLWYFLPVLIEWQWRQRGLAEAGKAPVKLQ